MSRKGRFETLLIRNWPRPSLALGALDHDPEVRPNAREWVAMPEPESRRNGCLPL
jgi:hypothetical protein